MAGVWGAGIIQGDDDGIYHLFVNVMSGDCPWLVEQVAHGQPAASWYPVLLGTNSHIVHAVSHHPEGPFLPRDVAIPNVANNPLVTRAASGKGPYYLWFEGRPLVELNRTAPICNGTKMCVANCDAHSYSALNPGPMSVATSNSLDGPWTIHPLGLSQHRIGAWDAGADLTNPAAYTFANGTTILVYRTEGGKQSWQMGVAVGPTPTGPFEQPNSTAFPEHAEDPVIWVDSRGVFQMLLHNCSGIGPPTPGGSGCCHCLMASGSAWSTDGRRWHVRGTEPYSYNVSYSDGSVVACQRREEPKLLFNGFGQPTHLVTLCAFANFTTRVIVQPIAQ